MVDAEVLARLKKESPPPGSVQLEAAPQVDYHKASTCSF